MKKKLLLLLMVVVFAAPTMMAQLTKGKPSADVIRTGNRAKAGDFGFYFGFYNDKAEGLFEAFGRQDGSGDYNLVRTPLPLVNMKYMLSNKMELRVGLEIKKSSATLNYGKLDVAGDPESYMNQFKNTLTDVDNIITPGLAYHFSNTNILDVYVGFEIPVGYTRFRSYTEAKFEDSDNDTYTKNTAMAWNVGLGGYLGVQAYIGNLPLAVGMEWGIFGRYNLNLKGTVETKTGSDDAVKTYYNFDSDLDAFNAGPFDEVKAARKFFAGNQLRFTVTYFFNK